MAVVRFPNFTHLENYRFMLRGRKPNATYCIWLMISFFSSYFSIYCPSRFEVDFRVIFPRLVKSIIINFPY